MISAHRNLRLLGSSDPPALASQSAGRSGSHSEVDAEYAMIASDILLGDENGADADRVSNGEYDLMAFNYYPNRDGP